MEQVVVKYTMYNRYREFIALYEVSKDFQLD
jgi:hypothetical protein